MGCTMIYGNRFVLNIAELCTWNSNSRKKIHVAFDIVQLCSTVHVFK